MSRAELVDAITAAVRARGGNPEGDELRFPCVEPGRHTNGDLHASARWNADKAVWFCDVCGLGGGALDLARRLAIQPDGDGPHPRPGRETVHVLRDADGAEVAHHVRIDTADGKRVWWRQPDGGRGLGGRRTKSLPLYRGETLRDLAPDATVVLVEGEKAADALAARGIPAVATVCGAAVIPIDDVLRVLLGRDVVLWPDADAPGREHMHRIAARLVALGGRVRLFDPTDATDGRDAADDDRDAETVRAALAQAPAWGKTETTIIIKDDKQESSARDPKVSQATLLLELTDDFELFRDLDADPVAYCRVGIDSHYEVHRIPSRAVRALLRRRFYREHHKAVRDQAVKEALGVLEARALVEGEAQPVATRIAQHDGMIYLDLCDAEWRVVEVSPTGWRIVTDAPVRFRRARGMLPLPEPVRGGTIEGLRAFINVSEDDAWRLVVGWLLAALRPQGGPFPVLALHGEQGSAKSTATRALRALVDPNVAALRAEPREPRDLMITATNGWIIALDNLSRLPVWLSDAICRLSTGGGFGTRELYSDGDEVLFDATRPVAVNGIEEVCVRGDLADRAVMVMLPAVAEDDRQTETDFWRTFEAERPALLGALLDVVVVGLRNLPHVRLDRVPRMADFAVWVVACEPALGWEPGAFLRAYAGARRDANESILEASAVAAALIGFMANRQEWTGTAGELLEAIGAAVTEKLRQDRHRWPQSPQGLSGALRRLAPALRAAGVDIERPDKRVGHVRRRELIVRRGEGYDRPHRPLGPQGSSDQDFSPSDADDRGQCPEELSARSSAENPSVSKARDNAADADDLSPASDAWGDL